MQLALVALHLPTRRAFDSEDDLDDRLNRAEKVFALAYSLGTRLVLARLGAVPEASAPETEAQHAVEAGPRSVFLGAARELALRADRQGVRLGVELHDDPPASVRGLLEATPIPALGASVDPVPILADGNDPSAAVLELGAHLVHVYAPHTGARSRNTARTGVGRSPSRATPSLDWEQFLGALEEVDYRGFLTVWPDRPSDATAQLKALASIAQRY